MKLRTAFFCKNCDEEIDLYKILKENYCPHCGYTKMGISGGLFYEWKVEVMQIVRVGELIKPVMIGKFEEGASCPVNSLDRWNYVDKPDLEKEHDFWEKKK